MSIKFDSSNSMSPDAMLESEKQNTQLLQRSNFQLQQGRRHILPLFPRCPFFLYGRGGKVCRTCLCLFLVSLYFKNVAGYELINGG